jgi:SAM-dependent methyltransferase
MADWGSGYVTDTTYVHDFCRLQTPSLLELVALAGGVAAPLGSGEPFVYCDLGCGQGYTTNIVAAANPAGHILGFDFNPSHIANARALASAAGLSNVEFRETSFEELLGDASLPEFDAMCMHGVYSWVSPHNRAVLVSLIRKKLRPGGLLYISYDSMPGWAAIAPLRRILVQAFAPRPGLPSTVAVEQALAYSDGLRKAGSRYHEMFPFVENQIERLKKTPRAYLAHELLTRDWEAFSFGDLMAELSEAKLAYLGSAHLTDWVDRVNFTEEQQAFLATIPDPILAESSRDMILGRQFRRDVFVKGLVPITETQSRARWLNTRFALTTPAAQFDMTFETALGKLQLRPDIYAPLIQVLGEGPITLQDLIDRMPTPRPSWISLTDAIKVLVGRGDLQPCLPEDGEARRAVSTRAFNSAVLARATQTADFGYLASAVTGGGVPVGRASQIVLSARHQGVPDAPTALAKLAEATTFSGKDGKPLSPDDARAAIEKEAVHIESNVLPMLQCLGID